MGSIKKDFLTDGMKFDADKYFMHANHTDFQIEAVPDRKIAKGKKSLRRKSRKNAAAAAAMLTRLRNTNQRKWQLPALSLMIFLRAAAMETSRPMMWFITEIVIFMSIP